jgi:glycosyltransferase involved in cell wall biosynthesis
MAQPKKRIGFISTRLSGTDGVSLEVRKWVKVLNRLGHECFYFAGESEWPEDRSYVVPEAHFKHETIKQLNADLFDDYMRSPETSQTVEKLKNHLKSHIHKFDNQFDLELFIVENAWAIPMNVPLGLALSELAAETTAPIIAHHHDFAWERSRFSVNAAGDYLHAAFPPNMQSVKHVVINSYGQSQLALRKGISSTVIPNVMDFDNPPPEPDGYADDLRQSLGIDPDEYFLLQPTRVVPRKRIEMAINLAARLDLPYKIVISHSSGDEGSDYAEFLLEYIELLGANITYAADIFNGVRGTTPNGKKIYSLADAYQKCVLVTYPSAIEGFGNAFLETIYYRRPLVMSTYEIYRTDIQPKGFKVVEFGDFIKEETVQRAREILLNPEETAALCQLNYEIASHHYSFTNLEKLLAALISLSFGD